MIESDIKHPNTSDSFDDVRVENNIEKFTNYNSGYLRMLKFSGQLCLTEKRELT